MLKTAQDETTTAAKRVAGAIGGSDHHLDDWNWKREILEGRKRRRSQECQHEEDANGGTSGDDKRSTADARKAPVMEQSGLKEDGEHDAG